MTKPIENETRSDRGARAFFHRRTILAEVLMGLVDECKGMKKEEVEALLGDSEIITGLENDSPENKGRLDVVCESILPNGGNPIRLWINIEPQNYPYKLGNLFRRARLYSAELGMMQSRRIPSGGQGGSMPKMETFSIWILISPPKWLQNTIRMFPVNEQIIGNGSKRFPDTNIDHLVFVCVGDPEDEGLTRLQKMLGWAMKDGYSNEERKAGLAELGIEMDDYMLREMDEMNSISRDRDHRMFVDGKLDDKIEISKRMREMGFDEDTITRVIGMKPEIAQKLRDGEWVDEEYDL